MAYKATIRTVSGTMVFEFDTDETTVGGIMEDAIVIAKECIDDAQIEIHLGSSAYEK